MTERQPHPHDIGYLHDEIRALYDDSQSDPLLRAPLLGSSLLQGKKSRRIETVVAPLLNGDDSTPEAPIAPVENS